MEYNNSVVKRYSTRKNKRRKECGIYENDH